MIDENDQFLLLSHINNCIISHIITFDDQSKHTNISKLNGMCTNVTLTSNVIFNHFPSIAANNSLKSYFSPFKWILEY